MFRACNIPLLAIGNSHVGEEFVLSTPIYIKYSFLRKGVEEDTTRSRFFKVVFNNVPISGFVYYR